MVRLAPPTLWRGTQYGILCCHGLSHHVATCRHGMARFGVYADLTVQIARIYLDGGFANTFCDSESAADRFAKIIGSQRFHFPALALTLFGSLFHQFRRPSTPT